MSIEFTPLEWVDTDDPVSPATPSDPKLNAATLNAREQFFAAVVDQVNALTGGVGAHELELAAKADLVGGTVPDAQIPAAVTRDSELSTGLAGKADLVAGKVPQAQLPAVALTDFLGAVATQSAMLALTGQRGDWCTRTDRGADWQLVADTPGTLASWREMTYPASPVSSVNGRTGGVTGLAEASSLATVATSGAYSDLSGKPTIPSAYTDEQAQDAVAALIAAGSHSGISFDYNDAANTLSATVSGGGGGGSYTDEQVRDVIGAALQQGTNVTISVNDAGDSITIGTSATALTVDGVPAATYDLDTTPVTPADIGAVPTSRSVTAGTGLTGGGDLTADRSLAVSYGTAAGTAAQGNDSRITGAVPSTRTVTAGTGLTGGGDLSANRTLAVSYGTASGTAAQGNDARLSDTRTPTDATVTDAKVASGAAIAESKLALASDAAAGTASRRTLGTSSTSAAAGNDGRFSQVVANTQTGTTYTLVLADAGKAVEMNNASANTLTVPPNSSVAFPVGTVLEVHQYGAGQTTVAAGAGVTLRAPDGAKLAKQYASASLRKRGTDEWVLAGSVTT